MPPDLRTDPDEELPLPADPDVEAHPPPTERSGRAPIQQEERRFVENLIITKVNKLLKVAQLLSNAVWQ